jgi:hypothetical protein
MAVLRAGVWRVVPPVARRRNSARGYAGGMSLIRSTASTAWRMAGDVRGQVSRARLEGERRVTERRHRAALAALGARAYALAKEGRIPTADLADEIAEVDARSDDLQAVRQHSAQADDQHDVAAAFPMLEGDDTA